LSLHTRRLNIGPQPSKSTPNSANWPSAAPCPRPSGPTLAFLYREVFIFMEVCLH
jgi:hypothetical protein